MKSILLEMFNGKRSSYIPFWEVWFCMVGFCKNKYVGDYFKSVETRIEMAQDLGMDAVPLCFVPTNVTFGHNSDSGGGQQRYDGGTLTSLEQLNERDFAVTNQELLVWQQDRQKIADAGLACWMTLHHCFHAASISMGLENFSFMLYDNPNFLHRYMEWVEERNQWVIDEVIAIVKPDFVLFDGDCAYKNGLMIKPRHYRELVFERTQETVSHLSKLNIPYTFHSDGKIDDLLPILIELGFSAFHGCEAQANDLAFLVKEFGDDICLVGNMDIAFLSSASINEVKAKTENMLKIGSSKGKFIAACNTSPQDFIPDENYLAFCEVINAFKTSMA